MFFSAAPTLVQLHLALDKITFEKNRDHIIMVLAGRLGIQVEQVEVIAVETQSVLATTILPIAGLIRLLDLALTAEGRKELADMKITKIAPVGQSFEVNVLDTPDTPTFVKVCLEGEEEDRVMEEEDRVMEESQGGATITAARTEIAQESMSMRLGVSSWQGLPLAMENLTLRWSGITIRRDLPSPRQVISRVSRSCVCVCMCVLSPRQEVCLYRKKITKDLLRRLGWICVL